MSNGPSKIIQLCSPGAVTDTEIYALDDNGCVWARMWKNKKWVKVIIDDKSIAIGEKNE